MTSIAKNWLLLFSAVAIIWIFTFSLVLAAPTVTELKLNDSNGNIDLDPAGSWKVEIFLSANEPVKWNTIAICAVTDSVCNRTSSVRYFTQTSSYLTSVVKNWDGQTSKSQAVSNGQYIIRATVKNEAGEETTKEFSSPLINIITGSGSGSPEDSDSNQTETEDDDYSVLSSQADAGSYTKSSKWQIGIGKDRLVLVGSRVTFKVEDSASDKERTIYYWSFGDGAAVRGAVASHTYRYPGVYQVVVTAKDSFGREAATRVKVKVIAPTVTVSFVDQTGSVRVSNQNGEEINLGNFQLIASDQPAFVFPANTIISVGQTIVIDQSISGLQFASQLSLLDPTGRLVAESNLAAKPKADLASQLVSLQARLLSAQHQLAATSFKSTGVATTKTSPALITDQEPALAERVVTLEKTSPSPLKRLLNFFKMK